MKNVLLILFFSCSVWGYAQGTQAAEMAVSIFTSTLPETQSLNHIRKDQDTLLIYHKNIAEKMTAILVLKEAELLSLEKTPARIERTTPYIDTFNYLDQILAINSNTIKLIDDFPELQAIPLDAILDIMEQSYGFVTDFELILSDGKDNHMLPTDRYVLISKINKNLAKVYRFSVHLNELLRLQTLTATAELPALNIQGPINEALEEIRTIINDI